MYRLLTGQVTDDCWRHAVLQSLPPYALCGAGLIVVRIGAEFPSGDPQDCPDCAAVMDHGEEDLRVGG